MFPRQIEEELFVTCRTFESKIPAYIAKRLKIEEMQEFFIDENKPNPPAAPGFCMLLRKHIGVR
mgnify:CR=1 FL=1